MIVASPNNPNIKRVRALMEKPRVREKEKAFVIEGTRMFKETPRELLREVYVSVSYSQKNHIEEGKNTYIVQDGLFKKLSDTSTPQGILAVVEQKQYELSDILQSGLVILLEGLQDPGNLGTIVRTGEGAGISGIIMDRNCADIYSPKVVRSTMGSIYRVPFLRLPSIMEIIPGLKAEGYRIYAALLDGSESLEKVRFEKKAAIIIGNEGNGISKELAGERDSGIFIPMDGEVESLNAAVSASIFMYKYRFDFV